MEEDFVESYSIRIIYSGLLIILTVRSLTSFILPNSIITFIELGALLTTITFVIMLAKNGLLISLSLFGKILFTSLSLCSIYMIGRGEWPAFGPDWVRMLFEKFSCIPYLLPFLVLLLPNSRNIDVIMDVFFMGVLLTLPLWLLNYNMLITYEFHAEWVGGYLPYLGLFILGCKGYNSCTERNIMIAISLIYFALMLVNARRNIIFSMSVYFFAIFLSDKYEELSKVQIMYTLIISFLLFIFWTLGGIEIIENYLPSLASRINEDTRSGVEKYFLIDFLNSGQDDWIYGRGISGVYNHRVFDDTQMLFEDRPLIETGYLNMLLKGGLSYAITIVLIMIYSVVNIIVNKPKNQLFLFFILLLQFIDLYTTTHVGCFRVQTLLFWLIVSLSIERVNDEDYEMVNN